MPKVYHVFITALVVQSVCKSWRHTGSGGVAPSILNLNIRWRWVVYFTPPPLPTTPTPEKKKQLYPLNTTLCGSKNRSERYVGQTNLLSLKGIEPILFRPDRSVVTTPTHLSVLPSLVVLVYPSCSWISHNVRIPSWSHTCNWPKSFCLGPPASREPHSNANTLAGTRHQTRGGQTQEMTRHFRY